MESDWRAVKLKDVCREITVGHVGPMASQYVEDGIPFLRSQNIEPFRINRKDLRFIPPDFHKKLKKSALQPGDVVVVRTGYPGTACVVPNDLSPANCADLVIIRPSADIDATFLVAIFNSTWGRGAVAGNLVGVAQQHFNIGAAKELAVLLPNIFTQRKIAAILSAYDDLIENNLRRIKILEEMAQNLYREWFVKFRFPGHQNARFVDSSLGPIPEGWEVTRVSQLSKRIFSGGTPSTTNPDYWAGEFPWLSSGETSNAFILGTEKTITKKGTESSSTRLARKGSTVIASAGQGKTRGQTSLLRIDSYINQSLIVVEPVETPGAEEILYLCISSRYLELRRLSDSSSSRGSITVGIVGDLPICYPPERVRAAFASQAKPCFGAIEVLLKKQRVLTATRDLLLPKLISGELDVSELDIEIKDQAA